jgi:hypothetical protein
MQSTETDSERLEPFTSIRVGDEPASITRLQSDCKSTQQFFVHGLLRSGSDMSTISLASTVLDNINDDEDEDHSNMPPPKPYYNRSGHLQSSTVQGSLVRSSSSQDLNSKRRDALLSKSMTQSMPNLHGARSQYNRMIGSYLQANDSALRAAGCGVSLRSSEFDALLEHL